MKKKKSRTDDDAVLSETLSESDSEDVRGDANVLLEPEAELAQSGDDERLAKKLRCEENETDDELPAELEAFIDKVHTRRSGRTTKPVDRLG